MGYLLLEERTWCLIQPVGAGTERGRDKKNKTQSSRLQCCFWLVHDPGSSSSSFEIWHSQRGSPGCLGLLALLPKEDWKLWMVSWRICLSRPWRQPTTVIKNHFTSSGTDDTTTQLLILSHSMSLWYPPQVVPFKTIIPNGTLLEA